MKSIGMPAMTPVGVVVCAGLAFSTTGASGQTWSYSRNSVQNTLRIDTYYLSSVRSGDSVTSAQGGSCAFGSCALGKPGCDNEVDLPDMVTPASAGVSTHKSLVRCTGALGAPASPTCLIASANFSAGVGLVTSTHSRITLAFGRTDSNYQSEMCGECSSADGTGHMSGSFAAAWPLNAPGGIDTIDVSMSMHSSNWSLSGDCIPARVEQEGVAETPHSATYTRVTATYYDINDQVVGTESFQGAVFSGPNGRSYHGTMYDDSNATTPANNLQPIPACAYGDDCDWSATEKVFNFEFTPASGAAYVGYEGEAYSTEGEYLDVNEDGVVDYFDRLDLAQSLGTTVDDAGYWLHADLDHDGDVDAADVAIIDAHPCIADLNDDGVVDSADVTIFLGWYGSSDPNADLNGDGSFNFFDTSAYTTMYSTGC